MITVTPKKNNTNTVVVRGVSKRSIMIVFEESLSENNEITKTQFFKLCARIAEVASKKQWRVVYIPTVSTYTRVRVFNTHLFHHLGYKPWNQGVVAVKDYRSL